MRTIFFAFTMLSLQVTQAATFDGKVDDWKNKPHETFTNPEANFKLALKKIRENFVDRDVTDEALYRAATAGMLASLNSGDENWNKLLSPREMEDWNIEFSGKLIGIGAVLKYQAETGAALVVQVLPGSAALKAGLKKDDQVLSVNGHKYKGKGLREMVSEIRGPTGETVTLKILREDRIVSLKIVRDSVSMPLFESGMVDATTGYLTIGAFTNNSPTLVQEKLKTFAGKKLKKLVIDLRGNEGGSFEHAIQIGEIFLPKDSVIVRTKSREGKVHEYKANGNAWSPEVRLVVLVDKETASGAELLAAALHDIRKAMTIGSTTHGKWNVQSLEELPNKFSIKYSIMQFESPLGHSYQGTGLKPDLEVDAPKDITIGELQTEPDMKKRLSQDPPLRAAHELSSEG